jgi:hypothetical protein
MVATQSLIIDADKESENESESENKALPTIVRVFFNDIIRDDGDFIEANCSLCKPIKRAIRGQYKAPSNFKKHISVRKNLTSDY